MGDTAWELFHRLDAAETEHYLTTRAAQGFNVIQAVALAECDGLRTPDAHGQLPFDACDPTRPNETYWSRLRATVARANALGLVVALLPTWGDKWNQKHGAGPEIFTPDNAGTFGAWLGERLRDLSVVWILGGDRPVETGLHREIIRCMAAGLRRGDGGAHLMTFHPQGDCGSSRFFQNDAWLDFHFRQNGHAVDYAGRYENTLADHALTPVRPVIDGEPVYEGIGVDFSPARHGYALAADARRACYWNLFSGACGHTYGHNAVWQMWSPERPAAPVLEPLTGWREALHAPGAGQMIHARRLFESRPSVDRVPDDALLVPHPRAAHLVPGAERARFVALRDGEHRWAMVYAPAGHPFSVRTSGFGKNGFNAWWFDPRTGAASPIGRFPAADQTAFATPTPGEWLDWVLVLDSITNALPAPGPPDSKTFV